MSAVLRLLRCCAAVPFSTSCCGAGLVPGGRRAAAAAEAGKRPRRHLPVRLPLPARACAAPSKQPHGRLSSGSTLQNLLSCFESCTWSLSAGPACIACHEAPAHLSRQGCPSVLGSADVLLWVCEGCPGRPACNTVACCDLLLNSEGCLPLFLQKLSNAGLSSTSWLLWVIRVIPLDMLTGHEPVCFLMS